MKIIPYIVIIVLLVIILLQRSCKPAPEEPSAPKIDTVIVYETIHDTVPGVIINISHKVDTSIWMRKSENIPDTSYSGLLKQYEELGNRYFATNVFKTDFPIDNYGFVTVTDTVYGNWLMSHVLTTNLSIPTTTITVEKTLPKKNEFYVGPSFTGNFTNPMNGINGVYGNILLKTRTDKLYGVSVGWNGEVNYGLGLYWKIKLRK